jgi:hypothetical protein
MAGKWNRDDVPKRGWSCVSVEDLDGPYETCAMCEVQQIRFVHTMSHPEYPETLDCGCICAGHMEGNPYAARARETTMRNRAERKDRWLDRQWRRSKQGNAFIKTDGYLMVIYPRDAHWAFHIKNIDSGVGFASRRPLENETAAKLRAFDALCWMQERGGRV